MGILGIIVLGLVAGALAKALHTGREPGGLLGTLFVGVAGALLGGVVASAAGLGGLGSFFSLWTWFVAIGGAFLLLIIYSALTGSRPSSRRPAR